MHSEKRLKVKSLRPFHARLWGIKTGNLLDMLTVIILLAKGDNGTGAPGNVLLGDISAKVSDYLHETSVVLLFRIPLMREQHFC